MVMGRATVLKGESIDSAEADCGDDEEEGLWMGSAVVEVGVQRESARKQTRVVGVKRVFMANWGVDLCMTVGCIVCVWSVCGKCGFCCDGCVQLYYE